MDGVRPAIKVSVWWWKRWFILEKAVGWGSFRSRIIIAISFIWHSIHLRWSMIIIVMIEVVKVIIKMSKCCYGNSFAVLKEKEEEIFYSACDFVKCKRNCEEKILKLSWKIFLLISIWWSKVMSIRWWIISYFLACMKVDLMFIGQNVTTLVVLQQLIDQVPTHSAKNRV